MTIGAQLSWARGGGRPRGRTDQAASTSRTTASNSPYAGLPPSVRPVLTTSTAKPWATSPRRQLPPSASRRTNDNRRHQPQEQRGGLGRRQPRTKGRLKTKRFFERRAPFDVAMRYIDRSKPQGATSRRVLVAPRLARSCRWPAEPRRFLLPRSGSAALRGIRRSRRGSTVRRATAARSTIEPR